MVSDSIPQVLKAQAEAAPDSAAISAPGRAVLNYGLLYQHIQEINIRLNELGIGRNDRVAIVLPNGPEMAVAFLAIASSATSAPLNPNYRLPEFDFFLPDLEAKAVIVAAGMESPVRQAAQSRGLPVIELKPMMQAPAGMFTLSGWTQSQQSEGGMAQPDEVALILHTSGTTSRPKMVPLTHRNLCASARNICHTLQLSSSDRCLNVMPLFHIHGLIAAVLSSLTAGGSVISTPGFDESKFVDWLAAHDATWYTAVPTMHQAVLRKTAVRDSLSSSRLRFIRSSSAALPPPVMEELERIFNVPVIESYGMTEASHQMCSNPLSPAKRKPGSVGLPAGPEVAILDEYGIVLPAGREGEIAIRGANVMAGYAQNPSANEKFFTNGWFRTGDLGRVDEEGYVYVTGRIKEMINKGGEKVSPREIDEVLLSHPAIAQAVAFAVPHVRLGEDVAVAVVLREKATASEQEIRDYARTRLADFKVPSQVVIVDQIPKGPTGKLQRIGLHEKLADLLRTKYELPTNPIEEKLARIWSKVFEAQEAGIHDNFFAMGGDSLLAAGLFLEIEATFKRSLSLATLFSAPTIKQLAEILSEPEKEIPSTTVIPLREQGNKPPLFCLAGADGHVISFRNLANHLNDDQPVYGLQYLGLDGKREPLQTIEDMAAEFVHEVRRFQPAGPYYFCGLCIGGAVAYEMARQLALENQAVAMLVMLDTYAPGSTDPRIAAPRRRRRLQLPEGFALSEWHGRVERAIRQAAKNYRPQPYSGKVIMVHPTIRRQDANASQDALDHGWAAYASEVQTYPLKIRYPDLLREPRVQLVAEKMRACLVEAQAEFSSAHSFSQY